MDSNDNGGPAFPTEKGNTFGPEKFYGMTLRDYFAAKALNGFLASFNGATTEMIPLMATKSYQFADAMLKARES